MIGQILSLESPFIAYAWGVRESTFGSVGCLVLTEPGQVLVFDPWHPVVVMLVVFLLRPVGHGGCCFVKWARDVVEYDD